MFSARTPMRAMVIGAAIMAMAAVAVPQAYAATGGGGSEVKAVVNNTAITSGDVAKRVNFLKLQHQKGDLGKLAVQQLVDETLKRQEITRVHMSVSTQDVDAAFGRFATSNKMSTEQLGQILDKMG